MCNFTRVKRIHKVLGLCRLYMNETGLNRISELNNQTK